MEWKYILKLHPDESQRPKPSANAQPLPEHLKESDASLDITNRTDGVPEIGDPFHDPNSEQKWAEWHTASQVTRQRTKVDLSKENRLWYYLGKPSTEAKSQYTENPARPRNNPKSNFLDTVKPPPPPVPAFHRAAYPATYPLKPAPIAVPPRTPMQQPLQSARPYQYRPKEPVMNAWKSPAYNADTRKNPNSPVAHQPNVSYDHRLPPSPYGQPMYQGYHSHRPPQPPQQYQYHPYIPPQPYSTTVWKAQSSTIDPSLQNGIGQYAQSPQHNKTLPAYPYSHGSQGLPPSPYAHSPGLQSSAPPFGPTGHHAAQLTAQAGPHGRSSIPNLMSNPSGTPKPPKYAVTPSTSSIIHAAQSPTEYLTYVIKYPYLRNAYLRRTKTYISPYSLDGGGVSQEWMSKQQAQSPSTPGVKPAPQSGLPMPMPMPTPAPLPALAPAHQGYYHNHNHTHTHTHNEHAHSQAAGPAASRPSAQFQSPDAFQREMARSAQPAEAPKWEQMLKQLATSTGSGSGSGPTGGPPSADSDAQAKYPPLGPRSGLVVGGGGESGDGTGTGTVAVAGEMKRPSPSPISEDGKGGGGTAAAAACDATVDAVASTSASTSTSTSTAVAPPLQGAVAPQDHGAETWRYS